MLMRVNSMRRGMDRMLKELCNERRIMWRVIRMDSMMIGVYLKIMSHSNEMENRYKKEKR